MQQTSSSIPTVLFLMHLPPPVHGAAMAGNFIRTSALINGKINGLYINLGTNKKLNESGKSSIKKICTLLGLIRSVLLALNKNKFDLCHMSLTASGAGFYKDLLLVALIKLYRVKLVYQFHNKGVAHASKNALNKALYKFVFFKTNSILLSPYLYNDIRQYVKSKNVFYCPLGIPANTIPYSKVVNKQATGCRFLFLSNMMKEKGVLVLLEALEILKNNNLNFRCDFVGAWSDVSEIAFHKEVEERKLTQFVFAHGAKYGNEKEQFFKSADVFLFPTFYHYETFGLVNLEAMQYGLPVISTFEGGIPDVVLDGVTGLLVEQRNSVMLAAKMESLILNPAVAVMLGLNGRKRFESHFTLDTFERNMLALIYANAGVRQNPEKLQTPLPT